MIWELSCFFGLIFFVVAFVLPLVALARAAAAQNKVGELERKISDLQARIETLRTRTEPLAPEPSVETAPQPPTATPQVVPEPYRPAAIPPPLPETFPVPTLPPTEAEAPSLTTTSFGTPGPEQPVFREVQLPKIDWEQFMGAKLFAWIGGLALFLGVGFFVKYSFEHNLIPPELRVAIGFVIGVALVAGGAAMKRKENVVTAHTLCGTGILILYAVTFACRAYYHFSFFGLVPTFLLMTLITAVAFGLAVQMNALPIAILGLAGGFLTPILLSTGQDNPGGLFGYIALLDIGLLLVAQRKEWRSLPVLAAIGTILMQAAWVMQFFVSGHYFQDKILIPMGVFLGFELLFGVGLAVSNRSSKADNAFAASAVAIGVVALGWSFYFLSFRTIGHRPTLLLGYASLADIGLIGLIFLREKLHPLGAVSGGAVFTLLASWMAGYLTTSNLYVSLGFCFLFALLHSGVPLALYRVRQLKPAPWTHVFPAIALLLVLVPILSLPTVSVLVWPIVLCLDVLAIAAAVMSATLLPVAAVLVLTIVVIGGSILRIPTSLDGLSSCLVVLGAFALFFLITSVGLSRRLLSGQDARDGSLLGSFEDPANAAVQLPVLSAALPFFLLILITVRLPLPNPSPVFGLALALVILLLGMSRLFSIESLSAVALGAVLALEHSWHVQNFTPATAGTPLLWYIGFVVVFTAFPFLFYRQFARSVTVWAVAAMAAPLHFYLIYSLIRAAYPMRMPGLVPAIFCLPAFCGLLFLRRRTPPDNPARTSQLALFGAATLFFVTLIFPIQFERQWITLGWALEGAALCWLFRRVPHPGLKIAATALLVIVFARLALNPAVLAYHSRAATPILNWYLYTYGIAAAALFVAGWLVSPPRHLLFELNFQAAFYALGTILVFLLLNIEIADYFTAPGTTTLTFQFSGNFARDMTYSIAWAGFALLLLVIGITSKIKPVRYASIGLLGMTLLKLFLHDLSQLEQLYRIAAFIIVAIVAIVASFLYQRFFGVATPEAR